jgi:hypothetical protein
MPLLVFCLVSLAALAAAPASAGPEGQITLARPESTAARWFDPAEAVGIITPFCVSTATRDRLTHHLRPSAGARSVDGEPKA